MYNSVNLNNNSNMRKYPASVAVGFNRGDLSNLHYNILHKDAYEEYHAKKRRNTIMSWAAVIGSTALVASVVFVGLVTGKSQNISKNIQNFTAKAFTKIDNKKNKHLHKFLTVVAGGFDKFSQVITNSSPIKDYALYKAMDKTKVTRGIRDVISRFYTKENISSVRKSRSRAVESYNGFISSVQDAIRESEKNPSLIKNKEKFERMKELYTQAEPTPEFLTEHFFSQNYASMENDMGYLAQEISMKRLLSKEALSGFVPERILMDKRSCYAKNLFEQKNKISCSFSDLSQYARERLNTANMLVYSVKDIDAQRKLRACSIDLEHNLKHYVKDSVNKENRAQNLQSIQKSIGKFKEEANLLPSDGPKDKLIAHLDEYNNLFADTKYGSIQEMRILAGEVWGSQSKHDIAIKKAADKHSKHLNNSLRSMINMFDKQRDITLGSGPNDVLGLIAPVALFGVALSKDKTSDERVGTSLELGIPIVGGMLVYLKTLALQFNGFRALATSMGTGVILNTIGSEIFKKYKKAVEAKKQKQNTTQASLAVIHQAAEQRKLQAQKQLKASSTEVYFNFSPKS